MSASVTLTCLLALQQLHVEPVPARVGGELVVHTSHLGTATAGVEVLLETPDGGRSVLGATDARGELRFTPSASGDHCFVATIAGVRCLAPIGVGPRWRGAWLALGTVPLGLALLGVHLRAARRAGRVPMDGPAD